MSFLLRPNAATTKGGYYGNPDGKPTGKSRSRRTRTRKQLHREVYKHDIPIPVHLNPHLDQKTKVKHLKNKLLAGHHVTHSEINIVAYGDKEQRMRNKSIEQGLHMTDSDILHLSPPAGKQELYVDKGIVGIPTPNSPGPLFNTFGTPTELRVSINGVDTQETHQRYRYFVDMSGFLDQEIKLVLQGRKLVVSGQRLASKTHNAKSASEVIRLPPGLEADNLRAVRDVFGTVILEEAWKF